MRTYVRRGGGGGGVLENVYKCVQGGWKSKFRIFMRKYFMEGPLGPLGTVFKNAIPVLWSSLLRTYSFVNVLTAQKMKFSIKGFFNKCDQMYRKLQIGHIY